MNFIHHHNFQATFEHKSDGCRFKDACPDPVMEFLLLFKHTLLNILGPRTSGIQALSLPDTLIIIQAKLQMVYINHIVDQSLYV